MKVFNKNNFMIHSLVPREYKYGLGIHITNDFTEATNGHYLIRVYCRDEEKDNLPETENLKPSEEKIDALISADSAREIERAIPKGLSTEALNSAWIGKNTNENRVEFICTDLETWRPIIARKMEGKFARTESVMNIMKEPIIKIGLNVEYVERLCQQFKKAGIRTIEVSVYGKEDAVKLEGKSADEKEQKVVALLMPIKL